MIATSHDRYSLDCAKGRDLVGSPSKRERESSAWDKAPFLIANYSATLKQPDCLLAILRLAQLLTTLSIVHCDAIWFWSRLPVFWGQRKLIQLDVHYLGCFFLPSSYSGNIWKCKMRLSMIWLFVLLAYWNDCNLIKQKALTVHLELVKMETYWPIFSLLGRTFNSIFGRATTQS